MARSLTVKPEEEVRTSPLFTGFLLLAVAWMILAAFAGGSATSDAETPAAEQFLTR